MTKKRNNKYYVDILNNSFNTTLLQNNEISLVNNLNIDNQNNLDSLIKKYYLQLKLEYSSNSYYHYKKLMDKYFFNYFDLTKSYLQININSLRQIKEKIISTNLSRSSINIIFIYIKKFLYYLLVEELIRNEDYFKYLLLFKSLKVLRKENNNYLKIEEIDKLFSYMKKKLSFDLYLLYSCLFYGALRISELLALTFNDVDFNSNRITINKSLTQKKEVNEVKTSSSSGSIYLPKRIIEGIKKVKEKEKASYDSRIFFPYKTYSRVHLKYILNKCIIESEITSRISLHGLRHTMASYMFDKGISIVEISKHLRHANPSITLSIYTHKISQDKYDLINELDIDK